MLINEIFIFSRLSGSTSIPLPSSWLSLIKCHPPSACSGEILAENCFRNMPSDCWCGNVISLMMLAEALSDVTIIWRANVANVETNDVETQIRWIVEAKSLRKTKICCAGNGDDESSWYHRAITVESTCSTFNVITIKLFSDWQRVWGGRLQKGKSLLFASSAALALD